MNYYSRFKSFIDSLMEALFIGLSRRDTRILPVNDENYNIIGYIPQFQIGWEWYDVRLKLENNWGFDKPTPLEKCKELIDEFNIQNSKEAQKRFRAETNVIKYP